MFEFVRDHLSEEELLAQLAEEASELAQAALKLRRALDGRNPTPVPVDEARACLSEEVADVMLCLQVLKVSTQTHDLEGLKYRKLDRWVGRLLQRDREGPHHG